MRNVKNVKVGQVYTVTPGSLLWIESLWGQRVEIIGVDSEEGLIKARFIDAGQPYNEGTWYSLFYDVVLDEAYQVKHIMAQYEV